MKFYVKKLVCQKPRRFRPVGIDAALKDYQQYIFTKLYGSGPAGLKSFQDWLKTEL